MNMTVDSDTARKVRDEMRSVLTMSAGDGDVWGWAMDAAFSVLDLMTLTGIPVPDEYDYSPGAGLDWPGDEDPYTLQELAGVWEHWTQNAAPSEADEALTYWGRVITRYLDLPAVRELAY